MKGVKFYSLFLGLVFISWQVIQAQDAREEDFVLDVPKFETKDLVLKPKTPPEIPVPDLLRKETTTVIVVRHAEKEVCPENQDKTCPLTATGEKRAETLARMLVKSNISVVFSTDTTRTKETVNNYADPRRIKVELYNKSSDVTDLVKSTYKGRSILVVGHSPTVPEIIKSLGVTLVSQINDEFDNLFIVTIHADNKVSMVNLKYPINHVLF